MRMMAMQLLTWGTILGAVGCALLLAAVERPPGQLVVASPLGALLQLPGEPTQAGPVTRQDKRIAKGPVGAVASAPPHAGR